MQPERPPAAPPEVTYTLAVDDSFQVRERVCVRNAAMRSIVLEDARAQPYTTAGDAGGPLAGNNGRFALHAQPVSDTSCVDVTVALGMLAESLVDPMNVRSQDGVVLATPDLFVLRPEPWPVDAHGNEVIARLRVTVPEGMEWSAPWVCGRSPAEPTTRACAVPRATWRLAARIAVGRFAQTHETLGALDVSVAVLGTGLSASRADLTAWLSRALDAVPLAEATATRTLQVLIDPVPGSDGVPFGMALRGGGQAALFLVGTAAPRAALVGEWVAVHELAHHLLPHTAGRGSWLSEGTATYAQNVLRARAQIFTPERAWEELVDGFARGRAASTGKPLSAAAAAMHADRNYLQVYWGGAAQALLLDVALREHASSLDAVIGAARASDPHDSCSHTPEELIGWMQPASPIALDALLAPGLQAAFPDVDAVLSRLGVHVGPGAAVSFDDAAPLAGIRRDIMTGGPR